jgi:large subunit ribosomal protein L9
VPSAWPPTPPRSHWCAPWPWPSPSWSPSRQSDGAIAARRPSIAEARDLEERGAAEAIATRLNALELTISRKTGENDQLYGSVTNGDIAELLAAKGFEIDRRKILLPDPIKALGENSVPVKLHRDVTANVRVTVSKEA